MNIKRSSVRLTLGLVFAIGLLFLGFWFLSPKSRTDDAVPIFPFYSPITPIGAPEFVLSKTVNNDNPRVGDIISYTLTYTNIVPDSHAFNVRLYDFLPAGMAFMGANPPIVAYQNGALVFNMPSVGPWTSQVGQVTVWGRVQDGYEHLSNRALVMADGVVPAPVSLLTTVEPTWVPIDKMGYSVAITNTELVYELIVENPNATVWQRDIRLIDILPTGLPFRGSSLSPDEVMPPMLTWSLDLPPREIRTVVVTTTAPALPGVITNTALADTRQRIVTQTMFSTLVITRGAVLRVDKRGSAPAVYVGDELIYTLRYENAGNEPALAVVLTDTFPVDISVTSVSTPAQSLTDQAGVWEIGPLGPGESGRIVITTTVEGVGERTLLNVADIAGERGTLQWPVYPGHDELRTPVRPFILYLPIVSRSY